jgi:hypothetical protein
MGDGKMKDSKVFTKRFTKCDVALGSMITKLF